MEGRGEGEKEKLIKNNMNKKQKDTAEGKKINKWSADCTRQQK